MPKVSKKVSNKRYRQKHKEEIKLINKNYYEKNKEEIRKKQKIYSDKFSKKIKKNNRKYYQNNILRFKENQVETKIQALNLLGGCKCVICGDTNLDHLTVDHIKGGGRLDRKKGLHSQALYRAIKSFRYPTEELSNLRVLCFNHNCEQTKKYFDYPKEKQTSAHKSQIKLWKEAFAFFGPCPCGESNLKFLTISHIYNDGAERRRNGERFGVHLIRLFRKQGWPENLKQDYRLECYNCNCSK